MATITVAGVANSLRRAWRVEMQTFVASLPKPFSRRRETLAALRITLTGGPTQDRYAGNRREEFTP